jgi:hypothetical protein
VTGNQRGGFGRPASFLHQFDPKVRLLCWAFSFRSHAMTDNAQHTANDGAVPAWEALRRDHARCIADIRPINKTMLFDALAAAGLTQIIVTFDGSSDSGQIENIEAKIGDEISALPPGEIEIAAAAWGQAEPERVRMSIRDAIEQLAFDFLQDSHGGWEDNDGAYGDFIFDVAERTITLDYNERHMESDYSQHVF